MIVICLCIHEKSPRETAVINSRASWIFKALLRIKKIFQVHRFWSSETHFSLQRESWFEFVWKTSILKIKMSLLGRKFSNNIRIRKGLQTGEEKKTAENQGTAHSRQQVSS